MDLEIPYVLTHYYEETFGVLSSSDKEEALGKLNEIKELLINGTPIEDVALKAEEEDDEWAAEMIEEMKRNEKEIAEHQIAEANKRLKSLEDFEKPNIDDGLSFSIDGEDMPPDF